MALNLSQKQEVVAELSSVAATAHSLIAAEYAGTTVSQMTAMRKKARESGVYLRVVKNTLASRAVAGTEFEVVQDKLVGPLLYAFSTEEPGAAGRLIKEFAKGNDKLQAKVVAVGGQLYPASHVEVLASLPHPLVVVLAGVGEGLSATGHRAMTMRRSSQRPDHHDRTRCSTVPDCVRVCVLRRHERAVRSTRRPCWVLNSGSSGMP